MHADYIILSHAHGDHLGDTVKIGKRCNSTVICVDELANYLEAKGLNVHNMHIGGSYNFIFGRIKLQLPITVPRLPTANMQAAPQELLFHPAIKIYIIPAIRVCFTI